MNNVNIVFLSTFAVIAIGYLLKYFKFLSVADGKILAKIMMHTTFPALMFTASARMNFQASLLVLTFGWICIGFVLLAITHLLFKAKSNAESGLMLMIVAGTNMGLYGFPIIDSLFGKEALAYGIMLDLANSILIFLIGYPIAQVYSPSSTGGFNIKQISKKLISLFPLMGVILGLAWNTLSLPIAPSIFEPLDILAKGNKPIALLLLGIYLSFDLEKSQIITICKLLGIRYCIMLIVTLFIFFTFPHNLMVKTVILCGLLPFGLTAIPFSEELGYDSKLTGTLLNASLIVSSVLMWVAMLMVN